MSEMNYLDFDLLIERIEGGYRSRVLNSPAGQASAEFALPFSELQLENFYLRIGQPRRIARRAALDRDWLEMETVKDFGGQLFEATFDDEVRACLRSSLDEASRRGVGLRIRLRLADAPELADLPWEYLYNPSLNRFLVLSTETPLVRYLDLPERIRPLAVEPPLRVLVMISSPSGCPPLDVEQEWEKLRESLGDLEQGGLLALERLDVATLSALQRRLRQGAYHIFHFIGHGDFDERAQDGVLLLEDEQGRGRRVSGQDLGMLLHDERTLRLAILNACEGARTSRTDPFAGTAQSLVQQGIPAVIAMQFEITDRAAIALTHEFYAALADGYPVDAALAEARKAIFAQGNDLEWGTPVLYMRAPDGHIFDVERVSESGRKAAQGAILYGEAEAVPQPSADRPKRTRWIKWVLAGALVFLLLLGGWYVAQKIFGRTTPSSRSVHEVKVVMPTQMPSPTAESAIRHLFSKDAQGNIIPDLIIEWELSPDGLTYTLCLQQDLRLANGNPFVAGVVEELLVVNHRILTGDQSFEIIDDYTIRVKLSSANPHFLEQASAIGLDMME